MTSYATDYDAIADTYDIERQAWNVPRDDVIDAMEPTLPATVLDIGCGTGTYLATQLKHFEQRPIRWVGIDPSAGMLAQAVRKLGPGRLVRGRAEDVPLGDSTVDYVFNGWVFHHVDDKERGLTEIARVSKPGGRLRMNNIDPWANRGWWVYRFFPSTWDADARRFWPVERIVSALERRGFDVSAQQEDSNPEVEASVALERARMRVTSQLAIVDDATYSEGLERLTAVTASDPSAALGEGSRGLKVTATKGLAVH